jgi:hypothetical protein
MDSANFSSLGMGLGGVTLINRSAQTRSISAENPTGAKGAGGMATTGSGAEAARELGQGWKVNPCIDIPPHSAVELARIHGPGVIQHIWITTFPQHWRHVILEAYWDDEETPSIQVPLGDFFCVGWKERCSFASIPICVNPSGGLNCYWPMPFRKSARIVARNITADKVGPFFYQISYSLEAVPAAAGYLHAQWRRTNPLPYMQPYTIVDGIAGVGQFVGVYMGWQTNSSGWWGEGEVKFYIDGDREFPTICGTGTEDYFGGAWCFEEPVGERYKTYATPFLGFHQHVGGDGHIRQGRRFGLYRWHIPDPIRFASDLRVTMQALGWREPREGKGRYLPLQDDICSVAYWYQEEPHRPFPPLPPENQIEVI